MRRLCLLFLPFLLCAQTTVRTVPTFSTNVLQSSVTKTANFSGATLARVDGISLIVTLDVTAADAGGTYDFYVTTTDGVSTWDLVHFSQIAGTPARYTALISAYAPYGINVSSATPGIVVISPSTLKTDTAGAGNGIRTLGVGLVRHGPWGRTLSHELVTGGAVTTGVTYSITVTVK